MRPFHLTAPLILVALAACKEEFPKATVTDLPEVHHSPAPPTPPPIKAVAFDSKISTPPIDFSWHICSQIVSSLENKPLIKDKYESTKEYTARMLEFGKKPYLDELKLGDQLAFSVTDKNHVTYDADKGILTVSPLFTEYNDNFGSGAAMLPSQVLSSSDSTYLGSNSFGVQKNVNLSKKNVCAVTMVNVPYFEIDKKLAFRKKVSSTEARSLDKNVRTIYIGTLASPYISWYQSHDKPEISHPYEKIVEGKTLLLKVQQVWLLNKETGAILAKNTVK